MQELKTIQKEEISQLPKPKGHDEKFLFLNNLINVFTRKLNIKNKFFYYKINRTLTHNPVFADLSYTKEGMSSKSRKEKPLGIAFENFIKASGSGHIYEIAPYLGSLSRLLSLIYKEASEILGEEQTKNILKQSFDMVKREYKETPDLIGYIPAETMGLSSSSSSAFSLGIAESMINYLVEDVVKKGVKPAEIKKIEVAKPSKEQISEQVMQVYTEMLGPLGLKQFQKLRKVDLNNITMHIGGLKQRGIINDKKAGEFKERVKTVFGGGAIVKNTNIGSPKSNKIIINQKR